MPYALIPDGYSLKKVTKLQKQAVNEKRRHDDVVAILNNENTPLVLAGVIAAVAVPVISKQIAEDLGADESVIKESVATAFYEGTLLGRITKLGQDFDFGTLPTKGDLRTFIRGR